MISVIDANQRLAIMVIVAEEGSNVNTQLMPVPFYEDTVVLVEQGNEPYVAMKPIAESLGVSWQGQHAKLGERFASTIKEILIVAEDGKPRGMTCLHLRKLPAWLYSISPNKVKPELRDKIIRYQEECDDALWNYWAEGSATRVAGPNVSQQIALSRHRVALLKELHRTHDVGLRAALHEQLTQTSRQLGLSVPELETIGKANPLPDAYLKPLWDALEILDRKGERYNHAPWLSGMIYLKLSHLVELFKKHGIALRFDTRLRQAMKESKQPKFVTTAAKGSSIEEKSIRCWIFEGPLKPEPSIDHLLSR